MREAPSLSQDAQRHARERRFNDDQDALLPLFLLGRLTTEPFMSARYLVAAAVPRSSAGSRRAHPWDRDLSHLERDIAVIAHDLGTDLDELLPQRGQQPMPVLFGQSPFPHWVINGRYHQYYLSDRFRA